MFQLRPYQSEAVAAIYQYFQHKTGNPLVVIPTAAGKSIIIADFIHSVFRYFPGQRVVVASHVAEILFQDKEKLDAHWHGAPTAMFGASLGAKRVAPVTFVGIASGARLPQVFGRVDLLIIDEAHLVSEKEDTQYQSFIRALMEVNPLMKIIGFTATPYRMKGGMLTEGNIFTDICYDLSTPEAFYKLVQDGYLSPLVPKQTREQLDTSQIAVRAGEYAMDAVLAAFDKNEITRRAVQEIAEYGDDRVSWLTFASGIEHAHHIAEEMRRIGIAAEAIDGTMTMEKRTQLLADFKSHKLKAIVNNNILTTGFDHPALDLIAVLRPTRSTGLWVQMLGRGCRVAEGKRDCLVLDFVGNTRRLGPINEPRLPGKARRGGESVAPVKVCEHCQTYVNIAVRVCPECGYEFPIRVGIEETASNLELIKAPGKTNAYGLPIPEIAPEEEFSVTTIEYSFHNKIGKPASLKVTYFCGLQMFQEYWCFEHGGFAAKKARDRWFELGGLAPAPETAFDAQARIQEVGRPGTIKVRMAKPYPEVTGYGSIREAQTAT